MSFLLEVEDLKCILPLAAKCFAEFKYPGAFNPTVFLNLWTTLVSSGLGHVLASYDGEPRGILGFTVAPDQFSGDLVCASNWWFVLPEHRGKKVGRELLADMESLARAAGCKRILMGHPIGYEQFFKSQGFAHIESGYEKVL